MEDQTIYSLQRLLFTQSINLLATEIENPNGALLYYDDYGRWVNANEAHKDIALKALAYKKVQLDAPSPDDAAIDSIKELEGSLLDRFGWRALPNFAKSIKPKSTTIQTIRNEYEFSELLNFPNNKDYWCEVIDIMAKAFHTKHNRLPTNHEAWADLIDHPPPYHGLQRTSDTLTIPGIKKALNRRSFLRRWQTYTT